MCMLHGYSDVESYLIFKIYIILYIDLYLYSAKCNDELVCKHGSDCYSSGFTLTGEQDTAEWALYAFVRRGSTIGL